MLYHLSHFSSSGGEGKKNKTIYGVWWKKRSTATVVSANSASEAKTKARQRAGSKVEGYGGVRGAKLLDDSDAKLARQGKWVRARYSDKVSNKSSYRPQLAKKQKHTIKSY